jgi:hypothetical protein
MENDDEARIASLAAAYAAADYSWELGHAWQPLRVGQVATGLAAYFPAASSFSLLSAWNPHSIPRPDLVNREQDLALQAALEATGRAFRPAFAAARNRSWREPGWLVADLPLHAVDALAQRFGQLGAVVWPREAPGRLRMYAREPVGAPRYQPLDAIDWVK